MVTPSSSSSTNANLRNGYDFPYSGNGREADRAVRVSGIRCVHAVRVDR